MKNKLIIFMFLSFTFSMLLAQEEVQPEKKKDDVKTIFSIDKIESNGAYISTGVGIGIVGSEDYYETNTCFAWVINHKFSLGMEVVKYSSQLNIGNNDSEEMIIEAGYDGRSAGLMFAPIFFYKKPVHFTIPLVVSTGYVNAYEYTMNSDNLLTVGGSDSDRFFIIKPGVELEINLYRWLRFGVNCQYQYALGVDLDHNGKDNKNIMNGVTGGIALKFGIF